MNNLHHKQMHRVLACDRRNFTMIELLVVMGLMVLLLGLMAPAFNKMTVGAGPEAATRAVTATLRQARQDAIAQRTRTAVIFPDDSKTFGNDELPFQSLHVCIYDDANANYQFTEGSKWVNLPTGAVFNSFTNVDTISVDTDDDGTSDYTGVQAIVFKPSGVLAGGATVSLEIVEGVYDGSSVIERNTNNNFTIAVNPFTGRVSVSE